jgi:hypothetical protein
MMITICSKFGTRGCGVEVGVSVGVGSTGTGVNVAEGLGKAGFVGGTEIGVQATDKTRRRIQMPERFMKISILSVASGVL